MGNRKLARYINRSKRAVAVSQAVKAFALRVIASYDAKMDAMYARNLMAIAKLQSANVEIETAKLSNENVMEEL